MTYELITNEVTLDWLDKTVDLSAIPEMVHRVGPWVFPDLGTPPGLIKWHTRIIDFVNERGIVTRAIQAVGASDESPLPTEEEHLDRRMYADVHMWYWGNVPARAFHIASNSWILGPSVDLQRISPDTFEPHIRARTETSLANNDATRLIWLLTENAVNAAFDENNPEGVLVCPDPGCGLPDCRGRIYWETGMYDSCHWGCDWCGELVAEAEWEVNGEYVCSACREGTRSCAWCGSLTHNTDQDAVGRILCDSCWDYDGDWCPRCDDATVLIGYDYCNYCVGHADPAGMWDYKPNFVFHPAIPEHGPLYMGTEIETSFSHNVNAMREVETWYKEWIEGDYHDLIYVKEDGTIENGFEINTHPMQFEWFRENFPFEAFQVLIDKHGAYGTHPSCGGHIHLNKEAFSAAHLWKFLKLHIQNGALLGMLGGRGTDSEWGSFTQMSSTEGEALKVVAQKKKSGVGWSRYVAVNLYPEDTVELRYPQGATDPNILKKNMQLVHASYTFAQEITIPQVEKGILKDPGYFLDWFMRREDQYSDLITYTNKILVTRKNVEAL